MRRPELIASVSVVLYIVFFALSPPPVVHSVLANPFGMAAAVGGAIYVTLYKSKAVGGLLLVALVLSMSRAGREGLTNCSVGNPVASKKWNYTGKPLLTTPSPNINSCGRACCGGSRCKNYMYNSDSKSCTLLSEAQTTGPMVAATGPGGPKMFAGSVTRPSEALPPPSGSGGGSTPPPPPSTSTPPPPPPPSTSTPPPPPPPPTSTPPPPPPATTPPPASTPAPSAISELVSSALSGVGAGSPTPARSVDPVMSCNLENYRNFKRSGPSNFAPF